MAEFAAANGVKRHPVLGGVIVGQPWVLAEVCRAFGFKNRCENGSVYLTDRKLAILGELPVAEMGTDGRAVR